MLVSTGMEVGGVELSFDKVVVRRGSSQICVSGSFGPGLHLVSGIVGSGKSTLAAMAAGLLKPDEGVVQRNGVNTSMLSFQFPEWSLTGNTLGEEVSSYGLEQAEILARAGLPGREGDDPLSLSRGELKKLNLACILGKTWDLLVLDEPFGAMDCVGKREICRWIEYQRSRIILLCTHEQHILPRVDTIWEFTLQQLVCRGGVPDALRSWNLAPPGVKTLLARGIMPANISESDLREAVCRIQD